MKWMKNRIQVKILKEMYNNIIRETQTMMIFTITTLIVMMLFNTITLHKTLKMICRTIILRKTPIKMKSKNIKMDQIMMLSKTKKTISTTKLVVTQIMKLLKNVILAKNLKIWMKAASIMRHLKFIQINSRLTLSSR